MTIKMKERIGREKCYLVLGRNRFKIRYRRSSTPPTANPRRLLHYVISSSQATIVQVLPGEVELKPPQQSRRHYGISD